MWRRRAEVEVVADVEASASKPHSKISAAGRRLGVGHRLTASLGYSVLRLQVRQRQQGTAAGRRQRTSGWKRWVRHRGGGARRDAGGSTRWPRRPARSASRAPSACRGVHVASSARGGSAIPRIVGV